ncbi:MAG: hypothetical protein NT125_08635 [Candidatus Bipolaricaulota bacterium]|nr:hypothetical protein [Candidatus Bipolaricaulota bacterium]
MTVFSELSFDDARQVFHLYCRSKGLAERTLQTYFSSPDVRLANEGDLAAMTVLLPYIVGKPPEIVGAVDRPENGPLVLVLDKQDENL